MAKLLVPVSKDADGSVENIPSNRMHVLSKDHYSNQCAC